ncbi:MAG: 6-carboxytetrahydropterin synthase [Holophagaceae bacterium]|nr:6-carboxytetrahydropterin synthase [Holophagaceae bacterium]
MPAQSSPYMFQAAVELPLSLVFKATEGCWEGHDYCVAVVVERCGLDENDVVMDFRVLESELKNIIGPLRGRLLSELGMEGPIDVAKKIAHEIGPSIRPPARLASVSLQDGTGRRVALKL